jgi:predicted RNA-binding Zn ribbon-like protein
VNIVSYSEWAIRLANTWDPSKAEPELIPDKAAVHGLLTGENSWQRKLTEEDVPALHAIRDRFRHVFDAAQDPARGHEAIDELNSLLNEFPVRPQITDHDGQPLHLHLGDADRPVSQSLAAAAALGLAALVAEDGLDRLGVCAHDRCWDVFVDTSTNSCRRYCSDTCSNRANVAAYRARRKAASAS